MSKHIRLNAFMMNTIGHLAPGQWAQDGDQSSRYLQPDYWVELARLLEKGRFDALFLGDVLGVYDVDGQSADAALRGAIQVPMNDPFALIPLMAYVTEHLGFGITASASYEPPYLLARRFTTLDHLSNGRVAWNIVTSYLESGARSLGQPGLVNHDERYDRADDYLTLCYKLWEDSWQADAVVRDREAKIYADPARIRAVRHAGPYYHSEGIYQCEPSPQRTPVLFQAGGSPRGRRFAVEHAECVFVGAPTRNGLRRSVQALEEALAQQGRKRESVLVYAMCTVIVERTADAAQARFRALLESADLEGARVLLSGWTGIDLAKYESSTPLAYFDTNAGQSALASFSNLDPNKAWTLQDAVEFVAIGGRGPVIIGDPQQAADELQAWMHSTGIDGFNLAYAQAPHSFVNIVELLVPELTRRGRYPTDYASGTLRDKLFGRCAKRPRRHIEDRFTSSSS